MPIYLYFIYVASKFLFRNFSDAEVKLEMKKYFWIYL